MDYSSFAQHGVHHGPEVFEQRRSVPVVVTLDRAQAVAIVLCLPALLPLHRMGIVEADQPLAIRPMQRQRIVQPVRLLRRRRHLRHHKADPVAAFRIDDEHLPIEIEQYIQPVAPAHQ
jgi:hypothetical protein